MWVVGVIIVIIIFVGLIILIINSSNKNTHESNTEKSDTNIDITIRKKEPIISEQERFGLLGEKEVANMLEQFVSNGKAYLFNDYNIKDEKGFSFNIDHLLICVGGIFVIETKSNKGIIHGNDTDEMWYAKKEDWQEDKEFKNPVKQNQGHINHLKRMFKNNPPKMFSLIVFPTAESLDNVNSKYTFDVNSAYEFINDKISESKYSEQFVNRMYKEFKDILDTYGISIEEHKENIKNMH